MCGRASPRSPGASGARLPRAPLRAALFPPPVSAEQGRAGNDTGLHWARSTHPGDAREPTHRGAGSTELGSARLPHHILCTQHQRAGFRSPAAETGGRACTSDKAHDLSGAPVHRRSPRKAAPLTLNVSRAPSQPALRILALWCGEAQLPPAPTHALGDATTWRMARDRGPGSATAAGPRKDLGNPGRVYFC